MTRRARHRLFRFPDYRGAAKPAVLAVLGVVVLAVGIAVIFFSTDYYVKRFELPDMAGPPGGQEDGYYRTEVYFATDRGMSEPEKDGIRFTATRGAGDLTYGLVEVSIPASHQIGEVESPAWWRLWDRDDPSEFVVVLSVAPFGSANEFVSNVRTLLSQIGREDVLVFVHGYSVTFDEAARRTAQLAYDLNFSGAPMFYSWPTRGEVDEYPADVESAAWSQSHFEEFLRLVLTQTGARKVHVIAHSMGARLLAQALSDLDPDALPSGSADLRQIVLAAPDIDAGLFRQLAVEFPGKAERVTLYSSRKDKALLLSERFNHTPRAGNSIVIVEGVDTIDATEAETGFLAHAYFGASIISDIFDVVQTELGPSDRFGFRAMATSEGVYWEALPGAFKR